MSANILIDASWDNALRLAQTSLTPPGDLLRVVRSAWTGSPSAREFAYGLHRASIPPRAIIEAGRVLDPNCDSVEAAVNALGYKGAATVAAICFTSTAITRKCSSERVSSYVLQQMIDQVEIGYHFGVSADLIGPDAGTLLGFGQSLGSALMVASGVSALSDAREILEGSRDVSDCLSQFGCEPYQVASLALQRLGFGPSLAYAAVMALGNFTREVGSSDEAVKGWWAASEWISALKNGERAPKRKSSARQFPDLLNDTPKDGEPPLHLQALYSSIDSVRLKHSSWVWHLDSTEFSQSPSAAV
jgi:hypothetical protein